MGWVLKPADSLILCLLGPDNPVKVTATLDPQGLLQEVNEANNVESIEVKPPTDSCTGTGLPYMLRQTNQILLLEIMLY